MHALYLIGIFVIKLIFLQNVDVHFTTKISAKFQVSPREMDDHNARDSRSPVKLRTFVEFSMDVASASPRRYFFEVRCSKF